jgi:queuine tRNA-ribosyltransferase
VATPITNAADRVTITTSVGFRRLGQDEYNQAVEKLQPDLVVGLADLVLGRRPGSKRRDKMVDQTHGWTRDSLAYLYGSGPDSTAVTRAKYLAPLLPVEQEVQRLYIRDLEDEFREHISGFAIYDHATLSAVPESLSHLVRFSFAEPQTPQEILREVSLGADITAVPFVGQVSDAGIALDFVFPGTPEGNTSDKKPLAYDMWPSKYESDLAPLSVDCQCYTCQKHHRAYIRHLLNAKEMLAWTLLQIHNHHIMDNFFEAVRASISNGTFAEDVQTFEAAYEAEFPQPTGRGPRCVSSLI